MKKILGIILIIIALVTLVLVGIYIAKKDVYQGDILDLLIDSFEFLVFIGALILLGVIFVKL